MFISAFTPKSKDIDSVAIFMETICLALNYNSILNKLIHVYLTELGRVCDSISEL